MIYKRILSFLLIAVVVSGNAAIAENDVEFVLNKSAVKKVVNSYDPPFTVVIDPNSASIAGTDDIDLLGQADVQIVDEDDSDFETDVFASSGLLDSNPVSEAFLAQLEADNGDAMLDLSIEAFLETLAVTKIHGVADNQFSAEQKEVYQFFMGIKEVREILVDVPSAAGPRRVKLEDLTGNDWVELQQLSASEMQALGLFSSIKKAVRSVWGKVKRLFKRLIKKVFRFKIQSGEITVLNRPDFDLKNPLAAKNIKLKLRATVEACIKIFKWRCKTLNTPRFRVEADALQIHMSSKDKVLIGTPRFKGLDWVISVRLFGFKVKIKIGLTSLANKQLAKREPLQFFDFGKIERVLPINNKKLTIADIVITGDGARLRAGAKLKVE